MKHILIIEDNEDIGRGLKKILEEHAFAVTLVSDGEEGLYYAQKRGFALVLLDIMLPYHSGYQILQTIRQTDDVPVIIMSAKSQSEDLIRGFDIGADDYVTKPFDLRVLVARIKRRLESQQNIRTINLGDLEYHPQKSLLLTQSHEEIKLSSKENALLLLFVGRPGFVFSREQIIAAVWPDDYEGTDRTVDNLVLQLRKKIGTHRIETIHKSGYKFQ